MDTRRWSGLSLMGGAMVASLLASSSLFSASAGAQAAPQGSPTGSRSGDTIVVTEPSLDDLYLAGEDVQVRAPVRGDLVAAGRDVRVSGDVVGDAIVAGERVAISGSIADDLRAAGRRVQVAGPVAGHLVAAGETIVIARDVQQWAWLAGNRIEVRGSVGALRATGDTVVISGEVRGDADLRGETIRLAPGAVVHGALRYESERPIEIAQGARVAGAVQGERIEARDGRAALLIGAGVWIVSFVLAVLLLLVAMPGWSALVARTARTEPWLTIAAGALALVILPLLIALSFLTGVLWIIGVVLGGAYLLALFAGTLLGTIALADLLLDLRRRPRTAAARLIAAGLTALAVALVALVPILGLIVLFVLAVIGTGASALAFGRARRGRPISAAPVATAPAPA